MGDIISYYVGRGGRVRVRTTDGLDREATDGEWLRLWSRDPRLTLRLASRS
ncbi:MAG: hypothetical protein HYU60_04890 [Magnetospirillum sp.]|nr:hypothetical protein [Magnetospirillum sp.]